MLARREYSALELRQKLTLEVFEADDIEQTISLLIKQKHQSDVRFARDFVQMRFNQGKGKYLINQQLKQKGIEAFDFSDFDFFALSKSVKVKKYGKQNPKNYREKAKQMHFLQSRGFGFDEINYAFEA